jgi:hypothetical protein
MLKFMSFYAETTTTDGSPTETLLQTDVSGEYQMDNKHPVKSSTGTQWETMYLFIPDREVTGLKDGMKAVSKEGDNYKVDSFLQIDDYQEIYLRCLDD